MKKSFMSNIKNFVDSNVRQRIDWVAHHFSEPLSDDILALERHFEDLRQVCIDADKKISALLQSIQLSSHPSHLGAYTQNVQAGLNNLSQNIGISTSAGSNNNIAASINKPSDCTFRSSQQTTMIGEAKSTVTSNSTRQQYRSNESLSNRSNTLTNSHDSLASHPMTETSCQPAEQHLSDDIQQRLKKLPVVSFYKFLVKSSQKLKQDSLLAITLSQCSQLQIQLTNLYLTYERLIENKCLKPIQNILENDIPNVMKLRKLYIKAHNDYEFLKTKYSGATVKQQQSQQNAQQANFTNTSYMISQSSIQQTNLNKLELLKNELDEAVTRSEQARDTYEAELYGFVCRETELVNLLRMFYRYQTEYHLKVGNVMQGLMPALSDSLALTLRKSAFGTHLGEHLRCTGREISPVIELCTHFLHLQGLKEEGLFRIPGSSMKIKKLKNGINAWFLSLASLEELERDQKRQSGSHCIVALYNLFKNSIGQQSQISQQALANNTVKSASAVDDAASNQTNSLADHCEGEETILDVHSLAGLLKLYLRELPEPLFTFSLYAEWIRCVDCNVTDSSERLEQLAVVIAKMPPAHRANLKHLIKFLHTLSKHQQQNKMTSTNLAIAMAPSLMWPRPIESDQQSDANSADAQSLNIQMSTFGISASHHAMILEALINDSEILFPEPADFSLPGFDNLKLDMVKDGRSPRRSRSVKSTSPTGLSIASSSSFSSNASDSTSPLTAAKGHSRKGGSMEGLLGQLPNTLTQQNQNSSIRSAGRPISVQLRRDEYSASTRQYHGPPSKPPIPTLRSQSRQASCDEQSSHNGPKSSNKPPAPPVPPPTSIRHQLERLKAASSTSKDKDLANHCEHRPTPRPTSLRGTGTIEHTSDNQTSAATTPTNSNHVLRPTVPPPERPKLTTSNGSRLESGDPAPVTSKKHATKMITASMTNGLQGRTENESASDDVNSPQVTSPDNVSDGDSSFDNESHHSLERSWSKCSLSNESSAERIAGSSTIRTQSAGLQDETHDPKSDTTRQTDSCSGEESVPATVTGKNNKGGESGRPLPPVKPPRSVSPKISQSTPL